MDRFGDEHVAQCIEIVGQHVPHPAHHASLCRGQRGESQSRTPLAKSSPSQSRGIRHVRTGMLEREERTRLADQHIGAPIVQQPLGLIAELLGERDALAQPGEQPERRADAGRAEPHPEGAGVPVAAYGGAK